MNFIFTLSGLLFCLVCNSQITLRKNTNYYSLPKETDSIYSKLETPAEGEEPGPRKGTLIDFFKFYGLNKDSLDIALELGKGKPVFLFTGSYTCPRFRSQIHFFDSLANACKNEISFYMIYIIEAHPHYPDSSPFMNKLAIQSRNLSEGIVYRQPKTYGQRKSLAKQMVSKTKIKVPVFIDSPSNQWVNTFGVFPNTACLIEPNAKVTLKYLDYILYKDIILRDLKIILEKKPKKL